MSVKGNRLMEYQNDPDMYWKTSKSCVTRNCQGKIKSLTIH